MINSQHLENEVVSSGDEFPEITDEELQVWARVERKRFHYRSCPPRDEHLLQQVLSIRPFEAKTPKARFEKWDQVAQNCDDKTKDLPFNSTGQLSFFFGIHAKRRFKVIMEAHHRLLTNSNNAIFASTYEGNGAIRSLVEEAYRLYLFAGYHPGSSSKRPEAKKRRVHNDQSAEGVTTKRLCSESKEILKNMKTLVDMQESLAAKWMDEQQRSATELIDTGKLRMENVVDMYKGAIRQITDAIGDERQLVKEKLGVHETQLQHTFKDQQEWMQQWSSTEHERQKDWVLLYENWKTMQQETAVMQQKLIEIQDRAEYNRMAFLRDILKK